MEEKEKLKDISARLHNESLDFAKYEFKGKISKEEKSISISEIKDILCIIKAL